MLDLSPAKLLVILVVALLVAGPDRLPRLARQLGAGWRTFQQFQSKVEAEVRRAVPDLPATGDIVRMVRSPASYLTALVPKETATGDQAPVGRPPAAAPPTAAPADPGMN